MTGPRPAVPAAPRSSEDLERAIEEHIQRVVDQAPPPTEAQWAQVAEVLRPAPQQPGAIA